MTGIDFTGRSTRLGFSVGSRRYQVVSREDSESVAMASASSCVAKWLNQAGVKTTYVNLEDVGLPGNGHQMMSEKNSAGIAKFFMSWLEKNVH
jgi:hypothetical protein